MAFLIALALLLVFVANVVMGATAGAQFMSNVGEMVILYCASIAFVAGILQREAAAKREADDNQ